MRSKAVSRLAVLGMTASGLVALSTVAAGCASRSGRIEDDILKTFPTIDADRDGQLSRGEFASSRLGKLGADNGVTFDRLDADNNDGISTDEMRRVIESRKAQK